jgi:hypothetical protein
MDLLTLDKGWVRTVIISQLIGKASIMRGLILSQYNVSGNNFAPVCTPIVYIKDKAAAQEILSNEIMTAHPACRKFAALLSETVSLASVNGPCVSAAIFPSRFPLRR